MLLLLVNQISRSFSTPSKNCTLSVLSSLVAAILRRHKIFLLTVTIYVKTNENFFSSRVCVSLQKCTINQLSRRTLLYYWEQVIEQSYWRWSLSLSLSLVCVRNMVVSIFLLLVYLMFPFIYCLCFKCVYPSFRQSRTTFGACAFYPTLFKIYRGSFFQCI